MLGLAGEELTVGRLGLLEPAGFMVLQGLVEFGHGSGRTPPQCGGFNLQVLGVTDK